MVETGNLTIHHDGSALRFGILGDVDHHGAKDLRQSMDSALYFYRPTTCVIDLSRVEFMDSSGLGLILGRRACTEEIGATLILEDPSEGVQKILALAGMERLITIRYGGTHEKNR